MKKAFNSYSLKGHNLEIKDFDAGSRKVAIYLSKFNEIDSDNDLIMKGAFKKSIEERGPSSSSNRQIAFLRHHNWEKQIGKFVELAEDNEGLFAVGRLGTSTMGEDALRDYADGIIKEHSIGFQYIPDKIKFIEDSSMETGGFFQIAEVKLWEGSAVTFGANGNTGVVDVSKSLNRVERAVELSQEIDIITKAIVTGKGSDERLFELEMRLKFLNARMLELASTEPIVKNHSAVIPEQKSAFNWEEVFNKL